MTELARGYAGTSADGSPERLRAAAGQLEQFQDVLAVVGGVARQTTPLKVDDEVQHLQGDLSDQNRDVVGDLHDVHGAEPLVDGQSYGLIDGDRADTRVDLARFS